MTGDERHSPNIASVSWGRMDVPGVGLARDFKLYPGGGRAWDWTETGTHHRPGIQIADLGELISRGSEIIVLSRGMESKLHTCPDVFELLHASGITVCVAETRAAVAIYNSLASTGRPVGGLFHSTC